MTADLILFGGTVLAVDREFSVHEAVAVSGERIVGVGSTDELLALKGEHTQLIDLGGRTVIPGMIDNHTHQLMAGLDDPALGAKVNISAASSIAEIKALIRAEAERVGPGRWITTSCMYRGPLTEGRFLNRLDLDEAAPANPVYIFQSGKNIIVNSLALKTAGIDRTTPDPKSGDDYSHGHVVRDADGEPTGHLIAGGADLARRNWWEAMGLPSKKWDFLYYDADTQFAALRAQMAAANAVGITGTRDMGLSQDEIESYRRLADAGQATVRTEMIVGLPLRYVAIDQAEALIESYSGSAQEAVKPFCWVGGFKFVLQNDGYWSHPPAKFDRLIRLANRLGWTLAIHGPAMWDRKGWEIVFDVLRKADAERSLKGRRLSLEHYTGTENPEDFALLREWDATIAPNPTLSYFAAGRSKAMHEALKSVHITEDVGLDPMEHARREWGLPIRNWIDSGVRISGGTDCPATLYSQDRPLLGMYCARTQDSLAGILLADQVVTPREALEMWTIRAAESMGADEMIGSIAVGKMADLVILTGNPITTADQDLLDIRVDQTFVGGRSVFERAA